MPDREIAVSRRRMDAETGYGRRGQRGSAAVELTLLAPPLVVLLLFTVAAGRLVEAPNWMPHIETEQDLRTRALTPRP